jgi:polar amino acid transport system permease protein
MGYQVDFTALFPYAPMLANGVLVTGTLSVITIVLSFSLALPGVIFRVSERAWLRVAARLYVHVLRNAPLLVLLYVVYFGAASFGLHLSSFEAGLIALTLNSTAFTIEIYRSGLVGVPAGQTDAAAALGLSDLQTWQYVRFPQALRIAYHSLGNQVVGVVLGTALVMVIGVHDLTFDAFTAGSDTFRFFEVFVTASAIYVVLVGIINSGWVLLGRAMLPKQHA